MTGVDTLLAVGEVDGIVPKGDPFEHTIVSYERDILTAQVGRETDMLNQSLALGLQCTFVDASRFHELPVLGECLDRPHIVEVDGIDTHPLKRLLDHGSCL